MHDEATREPRAGVDVGCASASSDGLSAPRCAESNRCQELPAHESPIWVGPSRSASDDHLLSSSISSTDVAWLRRAYDCALRSPLGDPNPRVGAVVVDQHGHLVGEGWHRGAGTPHAEPVALAAAGDAARGGTAYVTLEPCNHTGRTGPCSQALINAGIARVVYLQPDPNPVATGGSAALRAAGIVVEQTDAVPWQDLNPAWTFAMINQRSFVTWKYAATLDGRSAAADGSSRWITGAEARRDVHLLRSRVGAVLVGTGTVLVDDPELTVRDLPEASGLSSTASHTAESSDQGKKFARKVASFPPGSFSPEANENSASLASNTLSPKSSHRNGAATHGMASPTQCETRAGHTGRTVPLGEGNVTTCAPPHLLGMAVPSPMNEIRQPLRVVMGLSPIPSGAKITNDAAQSLILSTRDAADALRTLFARGIRHVLLEGGPTLAAVFFRAGLIDEVVGYIAPALLGAGRNAISDLGIGTIADAARFTITDCTLVGADVRITMRKAPCLPE